MVYVNWVKFSVYHLIEWVLLRWYCVVGSRGKYVAKKQLSRRLRSVTLPLQCEPAPGNGRAQEREGVADPMEQRSTANHANLRKQRRFNLRRKLRDDAPHRIDDAGNARAGAAHEVATIFDRTERCKSMMLHQRQ